MGNDKKFQVDFPSSIVEIIKKQIGILGNSESEIVKNLVLFYFKENEQLILLKNNNTQKRDSLG
jgi:hypothetical protein